MTTKKKASKKKRRTFNKKDWIEIFNRMFTNLSISMLTQALKTGKGIKFGGQPVKDANFLLPKTVITTTHHPKGRTPNPGAKKLRKMLAGGGDSEYLRRKR